MTNKSIEIQPGMGVYKVFKHLKYKPWFAIAEFIDNSLQSFLSKDGKYGTTRSVCKVKIIYEPNDDFLSIEDNAFGISDSEHQRAFTAGNPPSDRSGLSEFGMGMKSASIWFSPNWKVTTQAIDSDFEYKYTFDLDEVEKTNGKLTPEVNNLKSKKGFTKIELNNLHNKLRGSTIKKIKDHLGSIYRCYLRSNKLEISFNEQNLHFEGPPVLKAVEAWPEGDKNEIIEWKKTISFSVSNGASVSGFVAIREKGSFAQAGLSLFRRNRLIEGSDEDKYKPKEIFKEANSFQSLRIFGELHLEGFEVSHTKDAFNFGEYEEEFLHLLSEKMDSYPMPISKQAIKYRSDTSTKSTVNQLINLTTAGTKSISSKISEISNEITKETKPQNVLEQFSNILNDDSQRYQGIEVGKTISNLVQNQKLSLKLENEAKYSFTVADINWNITFGITDLPEKGLYKLEYNDEQSKRPDSKEKNIRIVIYKDHPLIVRTCNENEQAFEVLTSILITLSATEITMIASGSRFAHLYRKSFNELITSIINNLGNN